MPFIQLPPGPLGEGGAVNTDFITHIQLVDEGEMIISSKQSTSFAFHSKGTSEQRTQFIKCLPVSFIFSPARNFIINRTLLSHYQSGVFVLTPDLIRITLYFVNEGSAYETCMKTQLAAFESTLRVAKLDTQVAATAPTKKRR